MSIKSFALKYLPNDVLRMIRSGRYRRQLKDYPVASEPDLEGCKRLLRFGDIVIDVGANIGVYTKFCSGFVGSTGQVHAIEPIPETYSYLETNVGYLNLNNVTCYNLAISDENRKHAKMNVPDYASGGANLYEARLSAEGNISVSTTTLDTLFANLSPTLIKLDVEGHEQACIRGSKNMIERCRPSWLVEVSSSQTFKIFEDLNYGAFLWKNDSFRAANPTDKVPNYFFFAKEKVRAFLTNQP